MNNTRTKKNKKTIKKINKKINRKTNKKTTKKSKKMKKVNGTIKNIKNKKLTGGSVEIIPELDFLDKKIKNNESFSLSEYNLMIGTRQPNFNIFNGNFFVIYDPDAPNGINSSQNNKIFIHYLKIGNIEILKYVPPTPPKGKHRYITKIFNLSKTNYENILHYFENENGEKIIRTEKAFQSLKNENKINNILLDNLIFQHLFFVVSSG